MYEFHSALIICTHPVYTSTLSCFAWMCSQFFFKLPVWQPPSQNFSLGNLCTLVWQKEISHYAVLYFNIGSHVNVLSNNFFPKDFNVASDLKKLHFCHRRPVTLMFPVEIWNDKIEIVQWTCQSNFSVSELMFSYLPFVVVWFVTRKCCSSI